MVQQDEALNLMAKARFNVQAYSKRIIFLKILAKELVQILLRYHMVIKPFVLKVALLAALYGVTNLY